MAENDDYFDEEEFEPYPEVTDDLESRRIPEGFSEIEAASAALSFLRSDMWFVKAANDPWLNLDESLQRKLALRETITKEAISFLAYSSNGSVFDWDDAFNSWDGKTIYPFQDFAPFREEDYSVINDVRILTIALSEISADDLLHTAYFDSPFFNNNSCEHNWSIGILSCPNSISSLGSYGSESALLAILGGSGLTNLESTEIESIRQLRNQLIEILGKNFDFWSPQELNYDYFDYEHYNELAQRIRDFLWAPGNLSAEFRALLVLARGKQII